MGQELRKLDIFSSQPDARVRPRVEPQGGAYRDGIHACAKDAIALTQSAHSIRYNRCTKSELLNGGTAGRIILSRASKSKANYSGILHPYQEHPSYRLEDNVRGAHSSTQYTSDFLFEALSLY